MYVALLANGGVYKLDPVTGNTIEILSIPTGPSSIGLQCLPNGNMLLFDDDYVGKIRQYDPSSTDLGIWVDAGSDIVRCMRLTPNGTVAFIYGHPAYVPTKLVEYDLSGNYLRDVIPFTSDGMYNFVFTSDTEILVAHRVSKCIKRYDWTATPATFLGDFLTDCPSLQVSANSLIVHPIDGSVYSGHIGSPGVDGCLWAWDAVGTPLYGGQPLGCYGNPFTTENCLSSVWIRMVMA